MKSISRWMNENQFIIDNNRNFLISVTDPCDNSTFGDPTSWELILMGFGGCISSKFIKKASDDDIHFSDLRTEIKVNLNSNQHDLSFDIILRIKTSAPEIIIQKCLDYSIQHSPFGILTSNINIPVNTFLQIEKQVIINTKNKINLLKIKQTILK